VARRGVKPAVAREDAAVDGAKPESGTPPLTHRCSEAEWGETATAGDVLAGVSVDDLMADLAAPPMLARAARVYDAGLGTRPTTTAANYRAALRHFLSYCAFVGLDVELLATTALPATILEDYHAWQMEALRRAPARGALHATPEARERAHRRSAGAYIGALRPFFRFLARRGWLAPGAPYESVKESARAAVGRLPYPTPDVRDDVARLITYVESLPVPEKSPATARARLVLLRDRAILCTLYSTALRRAEAANLARRDVRDGRAAEALIVGKGDKTRVVFFDQAARGAIRTYLAERGDTHAPLFIRHDRGRARHPGPGGMQWRIDAQTIAATVERYAALAGVQATTHHIRHLKARALLHNDLPLDALQDVLGHASADTTKRIYAPLSHRRLRALVAHASESASDLVARADARDAPDEDGPTLTP